jgi:hypothetical protein
LKIKKSGDYADIIGNPMKCPWSIWQGEYGENHEKKEHHTS